MGHGARFSCVLPERKEKENGPRRQVSRNLGLLFMRTWLILLSNRHRVCLQHICIVKESSVRLLYSYDVFSTSGEPISWVFQPLVHEVLRFVQLQSDNVNEYGAGRLKKVCLGRRLIW